MPKIQNTLGIEGRPYKVTAKYEEWLGTRSGCEYRLCFEFYECSEASPVLMVVADPVRAASVFHALTRGAPKNYNVIRAHLQKMQRELDTMRA